MSESLSFSRMIALRLDAQFEGLLQDIAFLQSVVDERNKYKGDDELADIADTLLRFSLFAQDYRTFLVCSWEDYAQIHDLPKSNLESVIAHRDHQVIQKVLNEWLNLRTVITQRLALDLDINEVVRKIDQYPLLTVLKSADRFVRGCVSIPTLSHNRVRAYFQKTYSIGRFAYVRTPTVAIPLDSWRDPWHWMGLAHEIGHYVYWNAFEEPQVETTDITRLTGLEVALKEALLRHLLTVSSRDFATMRTLFDLWYDWTEEIFADIYGALLLGPAYIESLIAWLAPRLDAERLYQNDYDHPTPILRPLLQCAALRALRTLDPQHNAESDLSREIDEVEKNWLRHCALIADSAQKRLLDNRIEGIPQEALMQSIDKTGKAVVETLLQLHAKDPSRKPFEGYYQDAQHEYVMACAGQLARAVRGADELPDNGHNWSDSAFAGKLAMSWYAWKHISADLQFDESAYEHALTRLRQWTLALDHRLEARYVLKTSDGTAAPFYELLARRESPLVGEIADPATRAAIALMLTSRKQFAAHEEKPAPHPRLEDLTRWLEHINFSEEETAADCAGASFSCSFCSKRIALGKDPSTWTCTPEYGGCWRRRKYC